MKINIKPIKQETNRSCSVACLRIVLEFYGKQVSEKDILANCKLYNDSVCLLSNLAFSAIKLGFKAQIIGFNPMVIQNSKNDLREQIKERVKKNTGYGKACAQSYLKLINEGGKIEIKIPTLEDIDNFLKKDIPVILGIRPAILYLRGKFNQLHSIVIIGKENNSYLYIDPSNKSIKRVESNRLLASWYSRIPEMLIIKKK